MKLIVLSCEDGETNELLRLEQMFRGGLELFHLRKPDWNIDQTRSFLSMLDPRFLDRVVLHDHYALSEEFPVRGIHRNARNGEAWDHYRDKASHRSVSCHSMKELLDLRSGEFEYAFFSPVFASISKEGYVPLYTHEEIVKGIRQAQVPVIALGGITDNRVQVCAEMGFAGVAVLGMVWESPDPLDHFHKMYISCQPKEATY